MTHKEMSLKMASNLLKAIREIPTRPNRPWNAREAMELFVQHALVDLIRAGKKSALNELDASFYGPELGFRTLKEHSPPVEPLAHAIKAYMELVIECRPFEDVLVWVHAELLATKRGEGLDQFFTPPDMVELQVALSRHVKPHSASPRRIRIHEPACGAGGLLLGQIRSLMKELATDTIEVSAIDLDPFCVAMTALQLQAAQVLHYSPLKHVDLWVGNALAGPRKLGYATNRWNGTMEELSRRKRMMAV
ncbi:N-6 DNA methylase [Stenotrophomonas maltophilia]|uniref:N-6 DNA methylase n=1 Tax=Stenotrophomonas maltophilia TaxID=40324 RepID=UPI002553CC07|nr:N-6 DNA methylase [Stenotrophomonas maltophilia]